MKRYFKTITAVVLAALTTAACQKENFGDATPAGQEVDVTLDLLAPQIGTKSYGDGTTAKTVYVHVYQQDAHGNLTYIQPAAEDASLKTPSQSLTLNGLKATYSTRLVTGQTYTFVFWAQADGAPYTYDPASQTVTVNYTNAAGNDENRDAFYNVLANVKIEGAYTASVQLSRPFAQLNFGAADYEEAKAAGLTVTDATVTLTHAATSLNLLDGTTAGDKTVTFASAALPADPNDILKAGGKDYKYVAMDYVLVGKSAKTLSEVTLTLTATGAQSATPEFTYSNVPLQANYRTNIVGNLFTSPAEVQIEVTPDFGTPDNDVVVENVSSIAAANEAFANGATSVNVTSVSNEDDTTIILPKTNNEVSLTLPAVPGGKTVTIKYADDASEGQRPQTLNVTATSADAITIEAPTTHVELNGVTVNTVTASTSSTTLVVGKDVKIGTLKIEQGSAVIYGSVSSLTNNGKGNVEWHVKTVNDVVNAAKVADVIVFDEDLDFGNAEAINISKPTEIINNASLTFNTPWQFNNYSTLTIEGNGSIHSTTRGIVQNYKGGNLTVNKGSYSMKQPDRGAIFYNYKGATMTLNDVNVKSAFYAVYAAGKVTINGGEFSSTSYNGNGSWAYTIKASEGGVLTINDSKVYGVQGCIAGHDASTVTLNNVHAEARNLANVYEGNKAFNAVYSSGATVTTINSGSYLSDNPNRSINVGDANDKEAPSGKVEPMGKIIIHGGTFDDLSALNYLADDADVTILAAKRNYNNIYLAKHGKAVIKPANEGEEIVIAGIDAQNNNSNADFSFENIIFDNSKQTEGWFTGTANNIYPCVGAWGGSLSFKNCKFIVDGGSGKETGIMTWWTSERGADLTFDGCSFEGKDNNAEARAMQIYGKVKLDINNCTFTTAKRYSLKYVGGKGSTANIKNNKVSNCKYMVEVGSSDYPGENYFINFENNTLSSGIAEYKIANKKEGAVINGGNAYVD